MRWALVLLLVACGSPAPVRPAPPPVVEGPRPEEPPEPEPDRRQDTLDLAFTGDVMFGRFVRSGFRAIQAEEHDVFEDVAGILDSDFTMVNLETPVMRDPPGKSPWGHKMRFVTTPARVARLLAANVDAVTIANNHAYDMKEDGLRETPEILAELGLRYVGARRDDAPTVRVETIEVAGWRLGFIAATTVANWPGAKIAGMPYVRAGLRDVVVPVVEAARDDHDLVIVVLHWGTEYADAPSESQVKAARAFIDAGAAAVIGHHPHVLQGVERYGDGVIAYSLGNFLFDNLHGTKRHHGVLHLLFRKDGTCLDRATFHPTIGTRPHYAPTRARKKNFTKVAGRMRRLSKAEPLRATEWQVEKDRLVLSGSCED